MIRLQNEHQDPDFPSLLRLTLATEAKSSPEITWNDSIQFRSSSRKPAPLYGGSDHTSLIVELKLFKQSLIRLCAPKLHQKIIT